MTTQTNWPRLIHFARFMRVGVELLLLTAGLLLLLWAFSLSNQTHWAKLAEHRAKASELHAAKQRKQQQSGLQDQQQPASWLNGHHDEETHAWQAFERWLQTGQFIEGHCRFSGSPRFSGKSVELSCVGGQSAAQSAPIALEIEALNLIIAKPVQRPIQPPMQFPSSTPAHAVQGWIDLPSGTQHFNSQINRWQP